MNVPTPWQWTGRFVAVILLAASASGQYKQAVPEGFVRLDADEIKTGAIYGDPRSPGIYVTRNRFAPGQGSHPHYHDKARYITVIKGTWWVATGNKYDPSLTTPMPTGSFVTHFAKQVHWDGAKDEEAWLIIVGEGPATLTRVEEAK